MVAAPLLVLDSASLYYRSFHALPTSMTAPDGRPHNAVRGFLSTVARLVRLHQPDRLVAAWDDDWRPAWRVALVPSYKAHRVAEAPGAGDGGAPAGEAEPEELGVQVTAIAAILDALGVARWGVAEHEADDVVGSVVSQFPGPAVVVTGDRDLVQLVDPEVSVHLAVNGGMDKWPLLDPALVRERFDVDAAHYVDLAVLRGDPSDGLPGVPGIGAKTAAALVNAFGGVDEVVAAARAEAGRPMTPRLAGLLVASAEAIGRAHVVATAVRTLELPGGSPGIPRRPLDADALADLARTWGVQRQVEELREACAASALTDG